jgi:hypothetical protein
MITAFLDFLFWNLPQAIEGGRAASWAGMTVAGPI